MKAKPNQTIIERFLLPNPQWQEGYRTFNRLFGKPTGWLFIVDDKKGNHLVGLDRKPHNAFYGGAASSLQDYEAFLLKYGNQLSESEAGGTEFPSFFKDILGRRGVILSLMHLGKIKGFLVLGGVTLSEKTLKPLLAPLDHFLMSHVELAHKTFELNNFYETVHPRALALSTMHSVHRVISSSLRLNELLPRIGRLSAQVLKARGCSIMLTDPNREYLYPYFSFGSHPRFTHRHRIRIGRGLEGNIAQTGEFHLNRRSIGVPFIEDDVVGVILLWDKIENQPFTKMDLEILKSLSEQAVVAIKNAQLFEETEQLTLGSIKTINELLELNFGGHRSHMAVFGELILEIARALELSSREVLHLQRAIFLLNAGALAFPDQVWRKKGKLTKKEFDLIKRIPLRSANLLRSISSLKPVIPIVLHHHERFDGKGYPQGLKGEMIPIGARIVSVVDSFIAMITQSTYREAMTIEQARREMEANRGTQFDPQVVDCFLKIISRKEMYEKLERLQKDSKKTSVKVSVK